MTDEECYFCRKQILDTDNQVAIVELSPHRYYHLECYLKKVYYAHKKDIARYVHDRT